MNLHGEIPVDFAIKVLAVLTAFGLVYKKYGPDVRRFFRFLDAWEGYDGPDGKHVPGVLERLTRVEETAAVAASAAAAADQKVDHVSEQLDEVKASVEEVKASQLAKAAELTQIRQAVEGLTAQAGMEATDPKEQS